MTKTTTRHPGEFEHTLIHELNRLGMAAILQFRVARSNCYGLWPTKGMPPPRPVSG